MKKILLISLLLTTRLAVFSQVVMENHVPPFGTNYTLYNVTNVPTLRDEGANQNWNFSNCTISPLISYTITNPADVPSSIIGNFPATTYVVRIKIAPTINDDPMDFIADKGTCYQKIASKSSGSGAPEPKTDTLIVFNQTFGGITYYNKLNNRYAGYGTLTLKQDTYQNVVQMKSVKTGTLDTLIQFHQFLPHYQLLLSYQKNGTTITNGLYWQPTAATGLSTITNNLSAEVFPNPFENTLQIKLENTLENIEINIFNSQGKLIKSISTTAKNELAISTEELPKGLYAITIKTGDKLLNKKIIKN